MKERLFRNFSLLVLASVFFGAVLSLAIATCAALVGRADTSHRLGWIPLTDGQQEWAGSYCRAFGVDRYQLRRLEEWESLPSMEPGRSDVRELPRWARRGLDDPRIHEAGRFGSGWPFRCLVAGIQSERQANNPRLTWTSWGSVTISNTGRRIPPIDRDLMFDDKVPVRPIWTGLALNTLLFAGAILVAAWVPSTAVRMARHKLRHAAGRCPSCGYTLAGLSSTDGVARCPECGTAARPPSEPRL